MSLFRELPAYLEKENLCDPANHNCRARATLTVLLALQKKPGFIFLIGFIWKNFIAIFLTGLEKFPSQNKCSTRGYKGSKTSFWVQKLKCAKNKHAQASFLFISSLFLWASAPGIGHRGWYHHCGFPPRHHCVLQAVQEEETEKGGQEWGGTPQRKKRPHCVVRIGEKRPGRRRGGQREEKNTRSLLLSVLTLGIGACGAPFSGLGLFLLTGRLTFTFPFCLWNPNLDHLMGSSH